jgi:hypothetical protein
MWGSSVPSGLVEDLLRPEPVYADWPDPVVAGDDPRLPDTVGQVDLDQAGQLGPRGRRAIDSHPALRIAAAFTELAQAI